jgi:hypothetical protein
MLTHRLCHADKVRLGQVLKSVSNPNRFLLAIEEVKSREKFVQDEAGRLNGECELVLLLLKLPVKANVPDLSAVGHAVSGSQQSKTEFLV